MARREPDIYVGGDRKGGRGRARGAGGGSRRGTAGPSLGVYPSMRRQGPVFASPFGAQRRKRRRMRVAIAIAVAVALLIAAGYWIWVRFFPLG